MTQTKSFMMIGCLLAAGATWLLFRDAVHAEPSRGMPKWEYASLIETLPPAQTPYSLVWRTSKKRLVIESKTIPDGLSRLNMALGGPDLGNNTETPRFMTVLDRIGQDGWELVTHAHLPP